MKQPKPSRIVDVDYLDFVRKDSCVICLRPSEPHHLISRGAGGSDYFVIPLCREHHTQIHNYGPRYFQQEHKIDLWYSVALRLQRYIRRMKHEKGDEA